MKYTDNMNKMAKDHVEMKNWHESMAKSAAESMQDHIKAAAWHDSQSNLLKAMMNDVPLDPEKKTTTIPSSSYSAPRPASTPVNETEVPLDPETMKKQDLVNILKQHTEQYGEFDMDVEAIANFLITE